MVNWQDLEMDEIAEWYIGASDSSDLVVSCADSSALVIGFI